MGALLLGLWTPTALAAGWAEVTPGLDAEALRSRLGPPSSRWKTRHGEVQRFVGKRAPEGARSLEVTLEAQHVRRLQVQPVGWTQQRLEREYGPACATPSEPAPCWVRVKGGALVYAKRGLTARLKGRAVQSLVFVAPPAVSAPTVTSATPPTPEPAAALEQKPTVEASSNTAPPEAVSPSSGEPVASAAEPAPSLEASQEPASPALSEDPAWGEVSGFTPVTEEPSTPTPTSAPTETLGVKGLGLSGKLRVQSFFVPVSPAEGKTVGRQSVDLSLKSEVTFGAGHAAGTLVARRDFADSSRDRFDVDELFVTLKGDHLRLTAGRQLVTWGSATLTNPTDVLNPVDYRDVLRTEKRGAWMARAGLVLESFLAEVYYLPVPEAHLLPSFTGVADDGTLQSSSPWVVGSVGGGPSPIPLRYQVRSESMGSPTPKNAQLAGRLAFSLAGTDVSLGQAYLIDHLPTLTSSVQVADPPTSADVTLALSYRRQRVTTLDVERTFGGLRVAAEAALIHTLRTRPEEPEDRFLSYVLGGDYQTPEFLGDHQLRFFLEFAQTRGVGAPLRDDFVRRLRYPLERALWGRVEWQAGRRWTAMLTAATALNRYDVLVLPEVEFSFSDVLRARVGGAILRGDKNSFFGSYRDNSRVEGLLEASF
ncbi:DUF1302 family protein [Corallococcus llansteffanensis]|uniref:LPS-assembly protein LptD n=1 Tax=Corallococcus llansteffanensis TaxID=2316731 RepID=A0A3A8QPD2_9BACT|nr:DUF1302 family protein [Corallococcus llansteffanensis]RKH68215.1 hypothetical protein D7V93_01830 [Corallococcus llansteffanensis]